MKVCGDLKGVRLPPAPHWRVLVACLLLILGACAPAGPEATSSIAAGPLPAPVYFIAAESLQVSRIEADGQTVSQISFEELPVLALSVAARSGRIVYLTGEPDGAEATLVALDGSGRREVLSGAISAPVLSPAGDRVVYRLEDPAPGLLSGQNESPAGVWASSLDGPGRPALLIADVPVDGVVDDSPAWRYTPVGWALDNRRVALFAYDMDGPAVPGGELVILGDAEPVRGPSCCEEERWSVDGTALHVAGGFPGPDTRIGLFRIDALSGVERVVLDREEGQPLPVIRAPRQLADGQLYAFVAMLPPDFSGWDYPTEMALARIGADGITPLAPIGPTPVEVAWREDASGALIVTAPANQPGDTLAGQILWQPAAPTAALPLPARGFAAAWATGELAAGDCAQFNPIGYQDETSRRFSPEARDLQRRLAALGFDPGAADGLYGAQTRAAVAAFQQTRGLTASGDVDCATWQVLLRGP